MAILRAAPSGPLIRTPARPLNVKRQNCLRVLTRNMHAGPTHGRWQVVSTSGFAVVCVSYVQATELVYFLGARSFPRPAWLASLEVGDDIPYLDWLLAHHFRIDSMTGESVGPFDEQGVCRRPPQVMFSTWLRGWYPAAEDILATVASSIVEPALRARWQGR